MFLSLALILFYFLEPNHHKDSSSEQHKEEVERKSPFCRGRVRVGGASLYFLCFYVNIRENNQRRRSKERLHRKDRRKEEIKLSSASKDSRELGVLYNYLMEGPHKERRPRP